MATRKEQLAAEIAALDRQITTLRQEYETTPEDAPGQEKEQDFSAFIQYLRQHGRIE